MNHDDARAGFDGDGHDDVAGPNRRDAFRVSDTARLAIRVVEPTDFGRLTKALWRGHEVADGAMPGAPARPSDEHMRLLGRVQPEMHEWILWLEARVQALAAGEGPEHASHEVQAPAAPPPGACGGTVEVDLSAGGMSFAHEASLEPGTLMSLELGLSSFVDELKLVAEVVRCAPTGSGHAVRVSVRFRELHPVDRERLVRHIFVVQRAQLRVQGAR